MFLLPYFVVPAGTDCIFNCACRPMCRNRTASRLVLATNAIFFFFGFFATIRMYGNSLCLLHDELLGEEGKIRHRTAASGLHSDGPPGLQQNTLIHRLQIAAPESKASAIFEPNGIARHFA